MPRQSTSHLLLIEPASFYANPETMDTNVYQLDEHEPHEATFRRALSEFRAFRDMLVENGVTVTTLRGLPECPDHIFPNWISTHAGREIVIYPMRNENRRREKSEGILDFFRRHYDVAHDFSAFEAEGKALEATGSLCLDRVNKVAYATLSGRTDESLVRLWAEKMGYEAEIFETKSHTGLPVYHSDLVMNIGTEVAAICTECLLPAYRDRVLSRLRKTHEVIELTLAQLQSYCGNSLEILNQDGERMMVMSSCAHAALTAENKRMLSRYYGKILHSDIATIERYGGGSARCLIMEMF